MTPAIETCPQESEQAGYRNLKGEVYEWLRRIAFKKLSFDEAGGGVESLDIFCQYHAGRKTTLKLSFLL